MAKEEKTNKVGRPEKYTTHILPFLTQIEGWWISNNTNKWIAEQLGVSIQFFQKCMVEKKELKELYEKIPTKRANFVEDLKKAIFERAKGFEYEESKTILITDDSDPKGSKPKILRKEIYKKRALPDAAAAKEALFILGYDDVSNRASYELKRQELEFKKEQAKAESEEWCVPDDIEEGGNE
jgi:hypothetical protein